MRPSSTMNLALRIAMPTLLLAAGFACSYSGEQGREDSDISDTAPEEDSDTGDDTDSPLSDAEWFTVQGTLVVTGGDAMVAGSTIELVFHPSEAESSDTDVAIEPCNVAPAIQDITAVEPSDDEVTLHGWWQVALDDPDDDTCTTALPPGLHLGIGALEAALYPAMDNSGFDPYAGSHYGLYVQYGTGPTPPIWAFGIAGTEENFDGTVAASAPPLPDGDYQMVSLHLLPLD